MAKIIEIAKETINLYTIDSLTLLPAGKQVIALLPRLKFLTFTQCKSFALNPVFKQH